LKTINLEPGPKVKSSYLAARLSGYVVGKGGLAQFDAEVKKLGLDDNTAKIVQDLFQRMRVNSLSAESKDKGKIVIVGLFA